MFKIHLANIIMLCALGNLILWPKFQEPIAYDNIDVAYSSICMVTDANSVATGVLLESGYILTAAHVVDRNNNGKIDLDEANFNVKFHSGFKTTAKAIAVGKQEFKEDVALLMPDEVVPLVGVRMILATDYSNLKLGTPIYAIGMHNGNWPANITDGRIISNDSSNSHRNSCSTFMGNSGGGIFRNNELIGISVSVAYTVDRVMIPLFNTEKKIVGFFPIEFGAPLSNASVHIPVHTIIKFLLDNDLAEEALWEIPRGWPLQSYFKVFCFNFILITILFLVFKIMSRQMSM